jgi:hypothetical protein
VSGDAPAADTVPCRVCGATIPRWERYPRLVCNACELLAQDAAGRRMRFLNESILGTGFVAQVETDAGWEVVQPGDLHVECVIRGVRCVAAEHRFGGIVVQTVEG